MDFSIKSGGEVLNFGAFYSLLISKDKTSQLPWA